MYLYIYMYNPCGKIAVVTVSVGISCSMSRHAGNWLYLSKFLWDSRSDNLLLILSGKQEQVTRCVTADFTHEQLAQLLSFPLTLEL